MITTRNRGRWSLALSLATLVVSCGGGDTSTTEPGGSVGVELSTYQSMHPARGYVDANGGLYSNIRPGQAEALGGSPVSGYSWTVTTGTSMPFPGLTIHPLTGLVSGTLPSGTAPGSYDYQVTVSDGSTTHSSSGAYIQVLACDSRGAGSTVFPDNCFFPSALACGSGTLYDMNGGLTSWKASEPVGFSLSVAGGVPPYKSWTVLSGSLPPGLTLDASRGVLYGTPLSSAAGTTYTFSVGVSDSADNFCPAAGNSSASYKITIS